MFVEWMDGLLTTPLAVEIAKTIKPSMISLMSLIASKACKEDLFEQIVTTIVYCRLLTCLGLNL